MYKMYFPRTSLNDFFYLSVYSKFALSEYVVVLCNIFFHWTVQLDLRHIVFCTETVALRTQTHNRWVPTGGGDASFNGFKRDEGRNLLSKSRQYLLKQF